MSRWLKSVNNLLENLDGQAENVDIDGTIGQLIEKGQQVAKTLQRDDSFDGQSHDDDDFLEDEEDFEDDDEDIDFTDNECNDNTFDGNCSHVKGEPSSKHDDIEEEELSDSILQEKLVVGGRAAIGTSDCQASIHTDSVSELSCTERSEKTDAAELYEEQYNYDRNSNQPGRTDSYRKQVVPPSDSVSATVSKIASKGQPRDMDVSPRPPRRSADTDGIKRQVAAAQLEAENDSDGASSKHRNSTDSHAPPKPPTRQSSISLPKTQPVSFVQTSTLDGKQKHKSKTISNVEMRKLTAKVQSIQDRLTQTSEELKTSQTENRKLEKQVSALASQLEAANSEIHAQGEELRRAGERMEKDRRLAQEEREELLDDQDEEVEQLKALHTTEIEILKASYEKQLNDVTNKLDSEEARRAQESGSWTKELDDSVKREREALENLSLAEMKQSNLELDVSKLEEKVKGLQSKLEAATLCIKEAETRQGEAEDKLDVALSQHARQLNLRQTREAELEKTILDLGSALTETKRVYHGSTIPSPEALPSDGTNFKEKYDAALEESDTLRVQLNMETQRRAALEKELNEISKERSEEISLAQAKQLQQDRKVADLETNVAHLKSSLHSLKVMGSESNLEKNRRKKDVSSAEIEEARQEIAKLSDQLMRQQRMAEASKSEVLALKGRLQSATSRAEAAERSLFTAQSSSDYPARRSFDVENAGSSSSRRRMKGARRRPVSMGRTIRASLHLDHGALGSIMEQVVSTIDALDKWMVETGGLMRNEPLARLGFLAYLVTLHLWTFGLVIFHTVETPHGDFGTMDANPRHWRNHR
ncbi:unnamed protein product [Cylindrotheca closterium]|uniref:Golgin-84 n=1 Tax=Cylindrotheca closterium TaxID=2856 RepID=A0AAD2FTJ0_9STRA|nr:unnamed protein product [Cylindrotheca closterium]